MKNNTLTPFLISGTGETLNHTVNKKFKKVSGADVEMGRLNRITEEKKGDMGRDSFEKHCDSLLFSPR